MLKFVLSFATFFTLCTQICHAISVFEYKTSLVIQQEEPNPLTVSIIIPCHPLHVHFLKELLEHYTRQTVIPEEIVISISEQDRVKADELEELKAREWPFDLKIALSPQRLFAGANRNIAGLLATGDLFICQDADDIPHSQRVELIRKFFLMYKICHLIHGYSGESLPLVVDFDKARKIHLQDVGEAFEFEFNVHFGQCALLKKVFHSVHWPENLCTAEDLSFDNLVIQKFHSTILTDMKLLLANTSFLPSKVEKGTEYD